MEKQLLFIHGGDTFDTYEEYLAALASYTVDPYSARKKWRMSLPEELVGLYTVIQPEMPNKQGAHYAEWKLWFLKYVPFLHEGDVLIGHSLGAAFLAKFLSEEETPVHFSRVYLIAAPFFDTKSKSGGDFRFDTQKVRNIHKNAEKIVFFHSTDDEIVPFSDYEHFLDLLPESEAHIFTTLGHFIQESFPELIEDLKTVR